jgi:hypothetical protein
MHDLCREPAQVFEIALALFMLQVLVMKKAKKGLELKAETVQVLTQDLSRVTGGNTLTLGSVLCTFFCKGVNQSTNAMCTQ